MADNPSDRADQLLGACRSTPENVSLGNVLDLLEHPEERQRAIECLHALEDAGVEPPVGEMIARRDSEVIRCSVTALLDAPTAFPDETTSGDRGLQLFGSGAPIGRYLANTVIAESEAALNAVVGGLTADEPGRRHTAARALGITAQDDPPAIRPALDDLISAFADPDWETRRAAGEAVGRTLPAAPERIVDELVVALTDDDHKQAEAACLGVGEIADSIDVDMSPEQARHLANAVLTAIIKHADWFQSRDEAPFPTKSIDACKVFNHESKGALSDRIPDVLKLFDVSPNLVQPGKLLLDIVKTDPAGVASHLTTINRSLAAILPPDGIFPPYPDLNRALLDEFGDDHLDSLMALLGEDPSIAEPAARLLVDAADDHEGALNRLKTALGRPEARAAACYGLLTVAATSEKHEVIADDRLIDAVGTTLGADGPHTELIADRLADLASDDPEFAELFLPVLVNSVADTQSKSEARAHICALAEVGDQYAAPVPEEAVETLCDEIRETTEVDPAIKAARAAAQLGVAQVVGDRCVEMLARDDLADRQRACRAVAVLANEDPTAVRDQIGVLVDLCESDDMFTQAIAALTAFETIPSEHVEAITDATLNRLTDPDLESDARADTLNVLEAVATTEPRILHGESTRLEVVLLVGDREYDPPAFMALSLLFEAGVALPRKTVDRWVAVAETGDVVDVFGSDAAALLDKELDRADATVPRREALIAAGEMAVDYPDAVPIDRVAGLLDGEKGVMPAAADLLAIVAGARPNAVTPHVDQLLTNFERYLENRTIHYSHRLGSGYQTPEFGPFYAVAAVAFLSRGTNSQSLLGRAIDHTESLEDIEPWRLEMELGQLGINVPEVLPQLADLLSSNNDRLRRVAAGGFSYALEVYLFVHRSPYPEEVEVIVPVLVEAIEHPDDKTCEKVIHALGEVTHPQPDAEEAGAEELPERGIEALPRAIETERERDNIEVTKSTSFLLACVADCDPGNAAKEMDWCVEILGTDPVDDESRSWSVIHGNVAVTVERVAEEHPDRASEAIGPINHRLPGPDEVVGREATVVALATLAEFHPNIVREYVAVSDLVALLDGEVPDETRTEAARALGALGAEQALDRLHELANDPDAYDATHTAATEAIDEIRNPG